MKVTPRSLRGGTRSCSEALVRLERTPSHRASISSVKLSDTKHTDHRSHGRTPPTIRPAESSMEVKRLQRIPPFSCPPPLLAHLSINPRDVTQPVGLLCLVTLFA